MLGARDKVGYFSQIDQSYNWAEDKEECKEVNIQHKEILLMFLLSKDDNLLLLTGGLIYTILGSKDFISQQVKDLSPQLFGLEAKEEESKQPQNPNTKMNTQQGLIDSFL